MLNRIKSKFNVFKHIEKLTENVVINNVTEGETEFEYNDIILCWVDLTNQLHYNPSSVEFFINSNFTTSTILNISKRMDTNPQDRYIQSVMSRAFSEVPGRLQNVDYFREKVNVVLHDRMIFGNA